ncbi:hypothetical protein [Lyngbya sp. CCY1209]|uniref:hypothetical protein n=1 Tax=Lyngbya sp. CCY1209 TaxID=2886103 RepID=UPI002D2133AF|nr:hypothetical protein [Lyngbya sp. CCY1209]MEB3883495.1 hypothetical protein [Lyngbya sp. CCY1209]
MEILQSLREPCDRKTYGEKLRQAINRLGKSVRTVQRLIIAIASMSKNVTISIGFSASGNGNLKV